MYARLMIGVTSISVHARTPYSFVGLIIITDGVIITDVIASSIRPGISSS